MQDAASKTALMVAAYRARATRRPQPTCRDPWAHGLAGALGLELSVAFDRHFPHMELWIALRTEYLDRHVAEQTGQRGVDQVVLLGAGFDTRAARLARPGVTFFEVDHPATQAEKRTRVADLDGYPEDAARYVACDFETDDFVERLTAAGFDPARPAVVLWEGVTPYLSEDAVEGTARRVAEAFHARTVLYFDYLSRRMAEGTRLRDKDHGARDQVSDLGEPIVFGTNDPLPLMARCGFCQVMTVTFDQLALSLTGTYDRAREFRFQGVCVASREAALSFAPEAW